MDDNSTVTLSISTDSTTPIKVKIRVLVKGRVIDWKPITDTKYVGDKFCSKMTRNMFIKVVVVVGNI